MTAAGSDSAAAPPAKPPALLSPEDALALLLRQAAPLGSEVVELGQSLGRVTAAPVLAGRLLPPWDNSAMDGYAVRAADLLPDADAGGSRPLPVAGVVAAGSRTVPALEPGTALRIMTGAPLPAGADTVVMREDTEETGGQLRVRAQVTRGQHVRRAGEDVAHGSVALESGALIAPGEIGLLAALGRTLVEVHRRPQVAILSTGDELVAADVPPGPGQIANSNAHALLAQVIEAGGHGRILPVVRDDRASLRAAFIEAARADAVLSSGGVSVGEFDFTREVLAELGAAEIFSKVAMKPGKPLMLARLPSPRGRDDVLWFGLPGNPASSMVSFELFVRPVLRRMLGVPAPHAARPVAPVELLEPVTPDRTRMQFVRAQVGRTGDAPHRLLARPGQKQGSGMLRSMVGVNALLHIPAGAAALTAGTTVLATLLQPV